MIAYYFDVAGRFVTRWAYRLVYCPIVGHRPKMDNDFRCIYCGKPHRRY